MIELLLQAERALSVGLVDQAERMYRQASDADPRNAIAVVGLARVALERADDAEAYRQARRALSIDPENVAAIRLVARLDEVFAHRGQPLPGPVPPAGQVPPVPPDAGPAVPAEPRPSGAPSAAVSARAEPAGAAPSPARSGPDLERGLEPPTGKAPAAGEATSVGRRPAETGASGTPAAGPAAERRQPEAATTPGTGFASSGHDIRAASPPAPSVPGRVAGPMPPIATSAPQARPVPPRRRSFIDRLLGRNCT